MVSKLFCYMLLYMFFKHDCAQSFVSPLFYPCWIWLNEPTKNILLPAGWKVLYHNATDKCLGFLIFQVRMKKSSTLCMVKTGSTSNANKRLGTIGFLTIPSINFVPVVWFSLFAEINEERNNKNLWRGGTTFLIS